MSQRQALEVLAAWFGDREFLVWQITDTQLEEIAELLSIRAPELRMKVGRWLSNNRLECVLGADKALRLVVVSRADGSKAAVYQVQIQGN